MTLKPHTEAGRQMDSFVKTKSLRVQVSRAGAGSPRAGEELWLVTLDEKESGY